MWTCPKCQEKVEDDFEMCWACGTSVDGVENPDFDPEQDGIMSEEDYEADQETRMHEQLVTVVTFWNVAEAHIVRLRLEAAGIKVYLADEQLIAMDWLVANAIGGIKIQVAERDLQRARDALADNLSFPDNSDDDEEADEEDESA